MRILKVLAGTLLIIGALTATPTVTKIEPPNWWTGSTMNPVRVLLYGSGLSNVTITPTSPLAVSHISAGANGTHLFADITIPPATAPGMYQLTLKTDQGATTVPFRIDAPLSSDDHFSGFSPDDVIYLIMPDRFANGDPTNDDPAVSRGLFNPANSRFYHGGDFQGIIDHLPYLKALGVTALWLTPIYDNADHLNLHQKVNGQPITDYHGYGAVDYYGVEEHFGSLEKLRQLVESAHRIGIKVIQDQVANHVGPSHPWVTAPPTSTWFHGTAAHHLKETFDIWNLIDPHASTVLIDPVLDGWFADVLPDLNQSDPEVARYEMENAYWWVATAGFDGIRQDTLPYVPRQFWSRWSAALKQQFPKLKTVGEVLDPNPAIPSFFQTGHTEAGIDSGIDTVFDYPAYFTLRDAFAAGKDLESLIKTFSDDYLYPDPGDLVTILGDHDVKRFMSEPGASVDGLKLAFTFLLTARGIPVIYYGDEIGMQGGDDPDNRRDFPVSAFDSENRTPQQAAIFHYVQQLTAIRKQLSPLRRGKMVNVAEGKQFWAYLRQDDTGSVLVAINNGTNPVDIPIHFTGSKPLHGILNASSTLNLGNEPTTIHLAARSAALFTDLNPPVPK